MPASRRVQRYKKPPLVEAVVGFRFQRDAAAWDSVFYGKVHFALQKEFPLVETLTPPALTLTAGEHKQVVLAPELKRFARADHGVVITVAPDSVGVSVLPGRIAGGHPGWEFLRDTSIYALEAYRRVTSPESLAQVGVRYINAVPVEPSTFQLRDYLRAGTGLVPEALASERNPFSLRVERTLATTEMYQQREVVGITARAMPDARAELVLDVDELLLLKPGADLDDLESQMDGLNGAVHDVFDGAIAPHVLQSFGPIQMSEETK